MPSPTPSQVFASGADLSEVILNDRELVIVANTDQVNTVATQVLVERNVHRPGSPMRVLFSNLGAAGGQPGPVRSTQGGATVSVSLRPVEVWLIA